MALSTLTCNHLTPLGLEGLTDAHTPHRFVIARTCRLTCYVRVTRSLTTVDLYIQDINVRSVLHRQTLNIIYACVVVVAVRKSTVADYLACDDDVF